MFDPTYLLYIAFPSPELGPKDLHSLLCLLVREPAQGRLLATIGGGTGLFQMGGPAAGLVGTELPERSSLRGLEEAAKSAFENWRSAQG